MRVREEAWVCVRVGMRACNEDLEAMALPKEDGTTRIGDVLFTHSHLCRNSTDESENLFVL